MSKTRIAAALLVAWQALVSTEILFGALDRLAAPRAASSDASYPCAGHSCGCDSERECLSGCCCSARPAAGVPRSAAVRTLSAAGCRGHRGDGAPVPVRGLGPGLCPSAAAMATTAPTVVERSLAPPALKRGPDFRDPPDRVPI